MAKRPVDHEAVDQPPKREKSSTSESSELEKVGIHPLLRGTTKVPANFNPLKQSRKREGFVVNPYIDQKDIKYSRPKREFHLNEKGKYIERANEIRRRLEEEKREQEEQKALAAQGLTPDETTGEQYFLPVRPPAVEWWDQPLLSERRYGDELKVKYNDKDDLKNPITEYIQHPVPVMAPWEKHLSPPKPLYLTKKEIKRLRKNERQMKLKEKQDRMKLGLDPTPAPKVKLKNLMNVLTNDAIKNPTEVEMRVRQEIEERRRQHEAANMERHANKEDKATKMARKFEKDLQKGYFSAVFAVESLENNQHRYKVNINAKQLELKGMCLNLENGQTLIIVEGGERSVSKYKRLILHRIQWGVKCELVWEGQLVDLHFSKWTMYDFTDEDEILALLAKFRLENYWTQAKNIINSS
ncbi:hypothetical protein KL918_004900 [Ogataea parapolymorpha]|uniref:Uncharacterized protein n=1 Tax=Ogataea parapolymorpha (strain ATCC 26012 / BCRC 20466 / JCM 22074 / NRRL Y-7560 / DL-1) TaxID=871575 RepID=W1QGB1_OGAPD|nr:hypothetical protein HPODL_00998 [Ogataea parapolymorpha DL-1]ESX00115.1 hypothetical protein HPODL_00998 [Ogataea parapolymorpha DL-1]KAG7865024.1 hypothetical protein KL918_004900 [Ogataea parapolymorpha]KAG7872292.1 hypothetical protein KL916_003315 [Ogataea parapolymorpha]